MSKESNSFMHFAKINTLENCVLIVLKGLRTQNNIGLCDFINKLLNDEPIADGPKEIRFIEHVLKNPELFVINISVQAKEQILLRIRTILSTFLQDIELAQDNLPAFQF